MKKLYIYSLIVITLFSVNQVNSQDPADIIIPTVGGAAIGGIAGGGKGAGIGAAAGLATGAIISASKSREPTYVEYEQPVIQEKRVQYVDEYDEEYMQDPNYQDQLVVTYEEE